MKLYTEEQIKNEIQRMQDQSKNDWQHGYQSALNDILHIIRSNSSELPSDEEIQNKGECVFKNAGHNIYNHYNTIPSWVEGAKWMRDKIQGGNNGNNNNN
jgi:hypothetical protein